MYQKSGTFSLRPEQAAEGRDHNPQPPTGQQGQSAHTHQGHQEAGKRPQSPAPTMLTGHPVPAYCSRISAVSHPAFPGFSSTALPLDLQVFPLSSSLILELSPWGCRPFLTSWVSPCWPCEDRLFSYLLVSLGERAGSLHCLSSYLSAL